MSYSSCSAGGGVGGGGGPEAPSPLPPSPPLSPASLPSDSPGMSVSVPLPSPAGPLAVLPSGPLLAPLHVPLARPAQGLRDRRDRAAFAAVLGASRCNRLASDRARVPMPWRGPATRVRRGVADGSSCSSDGSSSRGPPQPAHERGAVGCSVDDATAGRETAGTAGRVVAHLTRLRLASTSSLPPCRCAAASMSRRTARRVVDG